MSAKWNFFQKVTVSDTSFPTDPQASFSFHTQGFLFFNEGTVSVDYSFNGTNIHGNIPASAKIQFDDRVTNKIWLQAASGSPVVRVEAWANISAEFSGDFFRSADISDSSFPTDPQVNFGFISKGFRLENIGSTTLEYSFDGSERHGTLDPSDNSIIRLFENRRGNKIWFRNTSGTETVEVEAWRGQ